MTEDEFIDDIFRKEGDTYAEPPRTDQPTGPGGITLPILREFMGPAATLEDLKTLTHERAREIVRWNLRRLARLARFDEIAFEPLKLQMIDFAYNSGQALATRWLQRVLRVDRTDRIDEPTLDALKHQDAWLVHHALIAARLQMIDMATDSGRVRKTFEEGLENRARSFSLLEVP
jgi:lysozyme family protein